MTNGPLKDAIMDAVYVTLERDDMQTPCALPFMTSSEYGVCDGDGRPVSDESIASALNAVAKIQAEYYRVKKEPRKETQKEMSAEPSPRPWRLVVHEEQEGGDGEISICAEGEWIATMNLRRSTARADAALIVAAVNWYCDWGALSAELERLRAERDRLRDIVRRLVSSLSVHHSATMAAVMSNREEFDTPDFRKDIDADAALLREARAAIGEDASP